MRKTASLGNRRRSVKTESLRIEVNAWFGTRLDRSAPNFQGWTTACSEQHLEIPIDSSYDIYNHMHTIH